MYTGSFVIYIKTDDITNNVEINLDTSNYDLNRPLTKGKNKKLIALINDELDGNITK